MTPLPPSKTYDAFISYSHADREVVKQIAEALKAQSLQVFLDSDVILPGDRFQEVLESGLKQSGACIVFIGPKGATNWQTNELSAAIRRETSTRSFRVIPVVLPGTDEKLLPIFLEAYAWVDYRSGADDREALLRLAAGVKGSVETGAQRQSVPDGSFFARSSTRELFEEYSPLDLSGIDYDTSLPLTDLARLVKLHHPEMSNSAILENLSKARASVYDAKYGDRTEKDDERFMDFEAWQLELEGIVSRLGLHRPDTARALVVGIGNGNERPRLYSRFQKLTITDVSPTSLSRCEPIFPRAITQHAAAEDLAFAQDGEFDIYISLRTFQSSFFNIRHAAFEANRVLRRGGIAVISVPNVYVGPTAVGKGLQSGDGRVALDANRSWSIADAIRRALLTAEFDCGIQTGLFEIYVTGRKVAP
jgi:SAM-dependent methyltransferase